MAITFNSVRSTWLALDKKSTDLDVTIDDACKECANWMVGKNYTFLDLQAKSFRGKDSDWPKDVGQSKAISDHNSKDASAYKLWASKISARFEIEIVGKTNEGRPIRAIAVDRDGNPMAKKDKGHNFSDALLERAKKSHGLTLAQLKKDDTIKNNTDLSVILERLDNQKALQINFERIRPSLVKARHEGKAFEVDDVLDIIRDLFSTTNLHVEVHGDDVPVTTRVSRVVEHTTEEPEIDPAMVKMFQQFMKMASNG